MYLHCPYQAAHKNRAVSRLSDNRASGDLRQSEARFVAGSWNPMASRLVVGHFHCQTSGFAERLLTELG